MGRAPGDGKENKRPKLGEQPVKAHRPQDRSLIALQESIEREYKMRDGAAKLLAACKGPRQAMEASKGMFVSNAKIIALLREVQQRQAKSNCRRDGSSSELHPCKAKIAVSEIRIPLEWREFEHIKGKTDPHVHCGVFCLLKIGNQVMDTPTLVHVDRSSADITFQDLIIFPERVERDFTLEVEVYCSVPVEESSSKPSTPIKMLKRLRSRHERVDESPVPSASAVPSSPYTPHLPTATPSHRFVLAGHTQLTLGDISASCRTYKLQRGSIGASGTASTSGTEEPLLPLWGQICLSLTAQPDCATQPRISGFINIQRMVSGLPDWKRLWCVVRQQHIRCWTYPEEVGRKMPAYSITIAPDAVIEPAPRLAMRRPNTLQLKDQRSEVFLAFEGREERDQWMLAIRQAVLDLQVWGDSCDTVIPTPSSKFYISSPSEKPGPAGPAEETLL